MKGRAVPIVAVALTSGAALVWLVVRSAPDDVAAGSSRYEEPVEDADTSGQALDASIAELRAAVSMEPDVVPPATVDRAGEPSFVTSSAPPAALQLLVTDEARLPVRDARIELTRSMHVTPFETEASDENGRASVNRAEVGDRVAVVAEGYEVTRTVLPALPWAEPMVVVLRRGSPWLEGMVVDGEGVPVADVPVAMQALSRTFRARTDAEGRFVFTGPHAGPPPEASLDIDSPSHCFLAGGLELPWSKWLEFGWPRLVVKRWATLDLVVEDAAGVAVGDATVVLRHPPEMREVEEEVGWLPGGGFVGFPRRAESKSSDGKPLYAMRLPPGYPWWVEIEHGAVGHERFQIGALAPGERAFRTVRLASEARSTRLAFVVCDAHANPIPGASAVVGVERVRSTNRSYERSDALGRFEIDPPGYDWTIVIRANGYGTWERAYPAGFAAEAPIVVALEPSDVWIEVAVRDREGVALEGVSLSIYVDSVSGDQVAVGRTDAEGTFAWSGFDPNQRYRVEVGGGAPGSYSLRPDMQASTSDLAPDPPAHRGVRAGATRLEFRMLTPGSIAGVAMSETAHGSLLGLSAWENEHAEGRPLFGLSLELGSDGRFAFVGLPPGHYRLYGSGLGSTMRAPSAKLDLRPGEDITDLELRPR